MGLTLGVATAIRERSAMEDRHAIRPLAGGGAIVAVFDGHGGGEVAAAAASRVLDVVEASRARDPGFAGNAWARIFAAIDSPTPRVGSTATVVCALPPRLHVAHVGDSRALLVDRARERRLTADHREETPRERARVLAAGGEFHGGYVVDPRRPRRGLMVTRALGDKELAHAGVIAEPETGAADVGDAVGFVVATDGLWDVLGRDADAVVARVVRALAPGGRGAAAIADHLVAMVDENGGHDNVTVVVGLFDAAAR